MRVPKTFGRVVSIIALQASKYRASAFAFWYLVSVRLLPTYLARLSASGLLEFLATYLPRRFRGLWPRELPTYLRLNVMPEYPVELLSFGENITHGNFACASFLPFHTAQTITERAIQ